MYILGFLLLIAGLAVLGLAMVFRVKGDADFLFQVNDRSPLELEESDRQSAVILLRVPFRNIGAQQGTLMDVIVRPLLACEQFSAAELTNAKVTLASKPRTDGYWEAALFPDDKLDSDVLIVRLKFTALQGDIRLAMAGMVDLPVGLYYQVVARDIWYTSKTSFVIREEEFRRIFGA